VKFLAFKVDGIGILWILFFSFPGPFVSFLIDTKAH